MKCGSLAAAAAEIVAVSIHVASAARTQQSGLATTWSAFMLVEKPRDGD